MIGEGETNNPVQARIEELASKERPVMVGDGSPTPSGYAPVYHISAHSKALVCDIPKRVTYEPATTLATLKHAVTSIAPAAILLIIQYTDNSCITASAFCIGNGVYCTALHNSLPSLGAESAVAHYYGCSSITVPPNLNDAINEPEEYGIFNLRVLSPIANRATLFGPLFIDDIDPRANLPRKNKCDFMILGSNSAPTKSNFFLPYPYDIVEGDIGAVIGFNSPIPQFLIDNLFTGMNYNPSLAELQVLFHKFYNKTVSTAVILPPVVPVTDQDPATTQRLLLTESSTLPTASGSVVLYLSDWQRKFEGQTVTPKLVEENKKDTPFHFIGTNVGSWSTRDVMRNWDEYKKNDITPDFITEPNYNLCVSVHHPIFVCEYAQIVLPTFNAKEIPASVIAYLQRHQALLKKYLTPQHYNNVALALRNV